MLSAVDSRTKVVDEEMLRELEELARSEQEILEALEEWQSLSADPENRYAYEMRLKWLLDQLTNIQGERLALEEGWKKGMEQGMKEGLEQGKKEGIKEGMKKGVKEGMKNLVRTMAKKGMNAKEIANLTDLAEEEVRDLLDGEYVWKERGSAPFLRRTKYT